MSSSDLRKEIKKIGCNVYEITLAKYLCNEDLILHNMARDGLNFVSITNGMCSKCNKIKCKHIKELSKLNQSDDKKVIGHDSINDLYFYDSMIFAMRGNQTRITSCISYHDDLSNLNFLSSLEFYACDLQLNVLNMQMVEMSTRSLLQEHNIKWRIEDGSSIIINKNKTAIMNSRRRNGI